MTKSNSRAEVFTNSLFALLNSKLCNLTILAVISVTLSHHFHELYYLLLPILFGGIFCHRIVFEIVLIWHRAREAVGLFSWYSIVDDNLLLGAIPLRDVHLSNLTNNLHIGAVLSIVEPFEFEVCTVVGSPIKPSDWKKQSVNHLLLSSTDYFPPSFKVLDEAAEYLNSQLSNNIRVYCHCKSGVGRSASAVVAYFIRYKGCDARTAHAKLRARRGYVFSLDSSQMRNMLAFENYVKGGTSSN